MTAVDELPCVQAGDALEISTAHTVLRFESWHRGLGTWIREADRWREEHRDWQLAFVGAARRRREAHPTRDFAATVPDEAVTLAAGAGTYEVTALRLLRHHPEAWDLARSAPRLFWIACARIGERGIPVSECGPLLGMKRAHLLGECIGAACSSATTRFVEKVAGGEQGTEALRIIVRAAREADLVRLFRHHERVSLELLHDALALRPLWPLRLFEDAVWRAAGADPEPLENNELTDLSHLLTDTRELGRALHLGARGEESVRALRRVADLHALHDRWSAELNARSFEHLNAVFPAPLVAGNADIEPLMSGRELAREGREMHHCVAAYAERCLEGRISIYRVLRPERATLELAVVNDTPFVRQLVTKCNAPVRAETRLAVDEWLEAARLTRDA